MHEGFDNPMWPMIVDGEVREVQLPRGLRARITAAPRFLSPGCRIGKTPLDLRLEPGSYQVVLRAPGRETVTNAIEVTRRELGTAKLTPGLPPAGTTPPGWIYIPGTADKKGPRARAFWIMEREVTCAEYLRLARHLHPDDPRRREIAEADQVSRGRLLLRKVLNRRWLGELEPRRAAAQSARLR